jgi:tetratricopeptide (TPR) repeat protein
MRNGHLILVCLAAGLMLGPSGLAQSSNGQAVPDAPQPQKKPAPKAQSPPSTPTEPADDKATPQPAAKDDNAFPEAVSRQAAKDAESPDTTKKPPADDNPFPEAVSRQAAKDAQKTADPTPPPPPKSDLPPGVSSSSSSSSETDLGEPGAAPPLEPDPVRAKKDIDVGGYYLKRGDYQGALQRFKDATTSDPTDVNAIFGLAETQRMLKNNAEAVRTYQMYLEIVPNGPKAKQALKALKELHSGN